MKQCCFERHCSPLSPAHAEAREEDVLFPYNAHFTLSLYPLA